MSGALLFLLLTATPSEIEQRLERVVNGLLPSGAFTGRFGPKATLKERMAYYHTPGVSIAVINDGRIEWTRAFGVREQGEPAPVTERTLFQAGSVSKPIFAMAVMRLVQEKTLDLDEDVNRYLTSWKIPASESWQPRVTLRQLLTHSAGLTVHGFPGYATNEKLPTVIDILEGRPNANTPRVEVNILPGVQLRYSGGGTTVAQQAVVDRLGQPFPRIMRETLLEPLGMTDSTYEQPLPVSRTRAAATAHPWKGRPLPGRWHVYPEMAAAGLWTTPTDLARAGVELQKALKGESPLFSLETAKRMLTPSVTDEIGIGFFLEGKDEDVRFGHGGWDEGFVAEMTVYKDRGMGAVVMVNSNEGQPLLREIQRAVAREYGWPGYFPANASKATVADGVLESYTGDYATKSGVRLSVTRTEGGLRLAAEGQPPIDLTAESETKFHAGILNTEFVFAHAEKDRLASLTLSQGGRQTTAEKVALPPSDETAKSP
jgi:CubicO group peptidase (beta-lactamase class C family)